ncbi:MAG TPA: CDP-alcohol phosphatidyltransferase family protein [Actinomycetota bacterium]|nr:CDP-alcohol phosphatidyltransferase family protein [Actinomycetota bacterium]
MGEASAAPRIAGARGAGAKERDYWWTVLAVDPVALPLVRLLAARRWIGPDGASLASLALGLLVGPAYALGGRAGLAAGAVLFYVSFVLDCVDGKLARVLGTSSARGRALDELADGARRASAALGLCVHLWRVDGAEGDILWAAAYGILSAYFMEISGTASRASPRGAWAEALARRRLLPTPGIPDASAVVYVIGPLLGALLPALGVGLAMVAVAILVAVRRRLRSGTG